VLYGTGEDLVAFKQRHGRHRDLKVHFEGVIPNLMRRYKETDSEWMRGEIEQYMTSRPCPDCKGARLKPESLAVTIGDCSIVDIARMAVIDSEQWFDRLAEPEESPLTAREQTISRLIVKEIRARLKFLVDVGLDYLTLDRGAA